MPEGVAAVAEIFGSVGTAEVAADGLALETAASTEAGLAAAGATAEEAAAAGSALGGSIGATAGETAAATAAAGGGSAAAAGAGAGAGGSLIKTLGGAAINAGVSTAIGSLLAPKAPTFNLPAAATSDQSTKTVVPMPDPVAQQAAEKRSLVEQLARRGRASTILTSPGAGGGKLGS